MKVLTAKSLSPLKLIKRTLYLGVFTALTFLPGVASANPSFSSNVASQPGSSTQQFGSPNQPEATFINPTFVNNYFGTWRGYFRKTQGSLSCLPQGALQFSVNQFNELQGFYNPGGGSIYGDVYSNGQFYASTIDGTEIQGTIRNGFVTGSYRNYSYGCSGIIQAQR